MHDTFAGHRVEVWRYGEICKMDGPCGGGAGAHFPFIRRMTELAFRKEVTFIVGENGSGKSTLVEAIAEYLDKSRELYNRFF